MTFSTFNFQFSIRIALAATLLASTACHPAREQTAASAGDIPVGVYGALTGSDCEVPQAVNHLREWSLDLVNHSYHNSHRADLAPQRGYLPYGGTASLADGCACACGRSRTASASA